MKQKITLNSIAMNKSESSINNTLKKEGEHTSATYIIVITNWFIQVSYREFHNIATVTK